MDADNLKTLIAFGIAGIFVYWEWRQIPPHANRRYFLVTGMGLAITVLAWLGIISTETPVSGIFAFIWLVSFVTTCVFAWKYVKSKKR